jgi:Protein of unknown function (DUF3107)
VEITIGVQNVPRELVVETDATPDAIAKQVRKALETGAPIEIADTRGRHIIIPVATVGYVEIGETARKVGFHTP